MTKARTHALSIAEKAADEARGVIVCACALALIFATNWQTF